MGGAGFRSARRAEMAWVGGLMALTGVLGYGTALTLRGGCGAPQRAGLGADPSAGGAADLAWRIFEPQAPPPCRAVADWEAWDEAVVGWVPGWVDVARPYVEKLLQVGAVRIVVPDGADRAAVAAFARTLRAARVRVAPDPVATPLVRRHGPFQAACPPPTAARWLRGLQPSGEPGERAFVDRLAADRGVAMNPPAGPPPGLPLPAQAVVTDGEGLCVATWTDLRAAGAADASADAVRGAWMTAAGCLLLLAVPALTEAAGRHVDDALQFLAPDAVALAAPTGPARSPEMVRAMEQTSLGLRDAYARMGRLPPRTVRVPVYLAPAATPEGAPALFSYVSGLRLADRLLAPSYSAVPPEVQEAAHAALRDGLPAGSRLVVVPADGLADAGASTRGITLTLATAP